MKVRETDKRMEKRNKVSDYVKNKVNEKQEE